MGGGLGCCGVTIAPHNTANELTQTIEKATKAMSPQSRKAAKRFAANLQPAPPSTWLLCYDMVGQLQWTLIGAAPSRRCWKVCGSS